MAEGHVKAELEEIRQKMVDVDEMKKRMGEMERRHREELLELQQKRKDQDEILLQMMENATAANTQLTKVESEMQRLKVVVENWGEKIRPPEESHPPPRAENAVRANASPLQSFPKMMSCFNLALRDSNVQPDYAWQINDVSKMLLKQNGPVKVKSQPFKWNNYLVRSRMKMVVNENGNVSVSLILEEGGTLKREVPAVYYHLKDRESQTEPKHRCRVIDYPTLTKFKSSLPFQMTLTHKAGLIHHSYNVNDSIVIELYVEPPAIAQQVHSLDGTLKWRIDSYSKRRQMAVEELVLYAESPYFYTGRKGYRVKVRMWLDGCGEYKGRGATAGVYFLTGAFDDALPSIFPHRTTITLTNPKEPQRSITKTIDEDLRASKSYFINIGEFREIGTVVHNDTVFYRVNIQPFN